MAEAAARTDASSPRAGSVCNPGLRSRTGKGNSSEARSAICRSAGIGEDGMRFYAFGITPNHDNSMPRKHASAWADKKKRAEIARRMFSRRFPGVDVQGHSVAELRGMEGLRVRARYAELGAEYGVTWKGRDYDKSNWNLADSINRALSAGNASLYAVCAAVVCSLGYIPSLGFIHEGGTLPFVYDVAEGV